VPTGRRLLDKKVDVKQAKERIRPITSEVERLLCDNTKIMQSTQWKPEYDLESGLSETIQWHQGHSHLYKAEVYNV